MPRQLKVTLIFAGYACLIAVAVAFILFFGVTRTDYGRDQLRMELERQIASRFGARLQIGNLDGNIRYQILAGDVRLFSKNDSMLFSADSIIATPHWRSIFSRRISFGSLQLHRPEVRLATDSLGRIILPSAISGTGSGELDAWTARNMEVTVTDGKIQDRRDSTLMEQLAFSAVINHDEPRHRINFRQFTATVPGLPIRIDSLDGNLSVVGRTLEIDQLRVSSNLGFLDMDGELSGFSEQDDAIMDLSVRFANVDPLMFEPILPALKLEGLIHGSAIVKGSLSNISIEQFTFTHLRNTLAGSGAIQIEPDSLSLSVHITEANLVPDDLQPLISVSSPFAADIGSVQVGGDFVLKRTRQGLRANANLELQSNAGSAMWTASVGRPAGGVWAYTAFLRCDNLDLAALTDQPSFNSQLNGLVILEGSGLTSRDIEATLGIDLSQSNVAGRSFDALQADASLTPGTVAGILTVQQGREAVRIEGAVAWGVALPSYTLEIRTDSLNLGPLMRSDSLQTSLTGDWLLTGKGLQFDSLIATVHAQLDPAPVGWGTRSLSIPEHAFSSTFASTAAHPISVNVAGNLVDLTIEANTHSLGDLSAAWVAALREFVSGWKDNLHIPQTIAATPGTTSNTTEVDDVKATLDIRIKPMLTKAWTETGGLDTRAVASANGKRLDFQVSFEADSVAIRSVHARDFQSSITGSASLNGPIERTLALQFEGEASSWKSGRVGYTEPRLTAHMINGATEFEFFTPGEQGTRISGSIESMPDKYRIAFEELSFTIGNYRWHQPAQSIVDVFSDALRFERFRLETTNPPSTLPQSIQIDGVVASDGSDAARVNLESIGLGQLSDYIDGRRSFAGIMSGMIDWRGLRRPVLEGNLQIANLQLENHLLGQLDARSRYNPSSSELFLEVTLASSSSAPTPGLTFVENNLSLTGNVRVPTADDDGALDLVLTAPRIDAFFLQQLIESIDNVQGEFTGNGSISGTFAYPIFGGDFSLNNGSFRIPAYDLQYDAIGDVRVVQEGVVLDHVVITDSTDGAADVRGILRFNDYRYLSLDLVGALDELQIMNVDSHRRELTFFGLIWASGDVLLTGPIHDAFLRSPNLEMAAKSDLYIPIVEQDGQIDPGFIVYADSTGEVPEMRRVRRNILERRRETERTFAAGIQMDLNILAPQNSNIHLVMDPLLGDVINSVGSGRVQLQLQEGDLSTFGTFNVTSGDYLFTAGELFVRRFLINEGSITWTGDPLDPTLDISADYRARASRTGLPQEVGGALQTSLPLIVGLQVGGELSGVQIELDLSVDQRQEAISDTPLLEAYLNQPDRAAQHATSVLVTNSFLLSADATSNDGLAGSAFNSVSNLVASQLNRYINQVIPNADLTLGVVSDESAEDLDVSAAIALRLLNERLVFRGQGVYHGFGNQIETATQEGIEGEVLLEIRLTPRISFEVFYRREGDVLSETLIINETGAGLSYQAQFTTWRTLLEGVRSRRKQEAADTGGS